MVMTDGPFQQENGPLAVDEPKGWARPAPARRANQPGLVPSAAKLTCRLPVGKFY
jgi:hypothetical protein